MRPLRLLLASLALTCAASAAAPKNASGYVLEGMPLIRQSYNACGPASITQVLGYYGLNVKMEEVSRWTRPDERSYMSAQAIVNFAPVVGMEARLYAGGTLNSVRSAIKHGLPLIALQSHIPEPGKVIPHWRVIVGYDDARRAVYTKDPLLGYVAIGYDDFLRVWADQRGQFAVLYPPKLSATVRKTLG
ncbi:peptidase C39 [Deinococcus cavernae]|uniref:Peptidase C39 n=1 Tax=Deinococcus cavernae TaxID=2320857 RepID=A0A418VBD1_9DEIO|nr:C39 family peptidase [Deinococcus cavernae]RJF73320.1 peptidase C39 [Deinococcus cavernae]